MRSNKKNSCKSDWHVKESNLPLMINVIDLRGVAHHFEVMEVNEEDCISGLLELLEKVPVHRPITLVEPHFLMDVLHRCRCENANTTNEQLVLVSR
jgi:hypothetical protein